HQVALILQDADVTEKTHPSQVDVPVLIEIAHGELASREDEARKAVGIIDNRNESAVAGAAKESDSGIGEAGYQISVAIAVEVGCFHGEQMGGRLVGRDGQGHGRVR